MNSSPFVTLHPLGQFARRMHAVNDAQGISKAFVGACAYLWPRLSGHEAMGGVNTTRGH